jgi:hypothetical protein
LASASSPPNSNSPENAEDMNVSSTAHVEPTKKSSEELPIISKEDSASASEMSMHPATPALSPSPKARNDENLPPWISPMIQYLRGVTENTAWQDLVTEFLDFEKRGPPNGVSKFISFFLLKLN